MIRFINLDELGEFSDADLFDSPLQIAYEVDDHWPENTRLQVSLQATSSAGAAPEKTSMRMLFTDEPHGDTIIDISGLVSGNEDDPRTLQAVAMATGLFKSFEISTNPATFADAVQASDAFNGVSSLGRNSVELVLDPDDAPTAVPSLYDILTTMNPKPDYLALADLTYLPVVVDVLRVIDKLNCHAIGDLSADFTVGQAVSAAQSLDARDHRMVLVWNLVKSRPRDAVSLRVNKTIRPACGSILGMILLRNAASNAEGIPPLHRPVAGYDYPMPWKGMEMRDDVVLNEEALEKLATARINTVRLIRYHTGDRFVLSDVLTQYVSKTSALRLMNVAEVETFTANGVIEIVRMHMLRSSDDFITKAGRDCRKFLDSCEASGLLKPATDLNGQAYTLSIVPDQVRPFEAVRITFGRRPEGCVRAVFLETTLNK